MRYLSTVTARVTVDDIKNAIKEVGSVYAVSVELRSGTLSEYGHAYYWKWFAEAWVVRSGGLECLSSVSGTWPSRHYQHLETFLYNLVMELASSIDHHHYPSVSVPPPPSR